MGAASADLGADFVVAGFDAAVVVDFEALVAGFVLAGASDFTLDADLLPDVVFETAKNITPKLACPYLI